MVVKVVVVLLRVVLRLLSVVSWTMTQLPFVLFLLRPFAISLPYRSVVQPFVSLVVPVSETLLRFLELFSVVSLATEVGVSLQAGLLKKGYTEARTIQAMVLPRISVLLSCPLQGAFQWRRTTFSILWVLQSLLLLLFCPVVYTSYE